MKFFGRKKHQDQVQTSASALGAPCGGNAADLACAQRSSMFNGAYQNAACMQVQQQMQGYPGTQDMSCASVQDPYRPAPHQQMAFVQASQDIAGQQRHQAQFYAPQPQQFQQSYEQQRYLADQQACAQLSQQNQQVGYAQHPSGQRTANSQEEGMPKGFKEQTKWVFKQYGRKAKEDIPGLMQDLLKGEDAQSALMGRMQGWSNDIKNEAMEQAQADLVQEYSDMQARGEIPADWDPQALAQGFTQGFSGLVNR